MVIAPLILVKYYLHTKNGRWSPEVRESDMRRQHDVDKHTVWWRPRMWATLKNIRFFNRIFFHPFSTLADKILIVLLNYILLLETLQIKCWQKVDTLRPFLKWGTVHPGQAPSSSWLLQCNQCWALQRWSTVLGAASGIGILSKIEQRHILETYSSFQNLFIMVTHTVNSLLCLQDYVQRFIKK